MEYWVDILNQALIASILAVSLNVLMGYAGQISVAHVALAGAGGYMAGWLSAAHEWGFFPALVVGVLVAATIGGLLSLPALRLGTDHLILLTLAFDLMLACLIVPFVLGLVWRRGTTTAAPSGRRRS